MAQIISEKTQKLEDFFNYVAENDIESVILFRAKYREYLTDDEIIKANKIALEKNSLNILIWLRINYNCLNDTNVDNSDDSEYRYMNMIFKNNSVDNGKTYKLYKNMKKDDFIIMVRDVFDFLDKVTEFDFKNNAYFVDYSDNFSDFLLKYIVDNSLESFFIDICSNKLENIDDKEDEDNSNPDGEDPEFQKTMDYNLTDIFLIMRSSIGFYYKNELCFNKNGIKRLAAKFKYDDRFKDMIIDFIKNKNISSLTD